MRLKANTAMKHHIFHFAWLYTYAMCVFTKDIQLAANQPRIATSNAMSPNEWRPVLHPDLYKMDDRMRLDAKAVGKRIAWASVQVSLIPQAMRDAYNRRTA